MRKPFAAMGSNQLVVLMVDTGPSLPVSETKATAHPNRLSSPCSSADVLTDFPMPHRPPSATALESVSAQMQEFRPPTGAGFCGEAPAPLPGKGITGSTSTDGGRLEKPKSRMVACAIALTSDPKPRGHGWTMTGLFTPLVTTVP